MNNFKCISTKKNPLLLDKVNQRVLRGKNFKKNVIFSNKKKSKIIKRRTLIKISNVKFEKKTIIE